MPDWHGVGTALAQTSATRCLASTSDGGAGRLDPLRGSGSAERPDDRGGMLGVGAVSTSAPTRAAIPDAFERAVARSAGTSTRPDDRGEARGATHRPAPGAMLLLVLCGAAIAVSVRRRGRPALP